jgi:signal transduction histidine kinase
MTNTAIPLIWSGLVRLAGLFRGCMLHEFITTHRDTIITRSREKLTARPWPISTVAELESGVPLFLTQLADALRQEEQGIPYSSVDIGTGATRHGRDLLTLGFTVSQVVHDYGDICQAVTELAIDQNARITTEEFRTLNRCLDTAIADAVTEHERASAERRTREDTERAGMVAHETRDLLNSAVLAFEALKRGSVGINSSTVAILARSLTSLLDLVANTLTDIRITERSQRRELTRVAAFMNEVVSTSGLQADARGVRLDIEPVDDRLAMLADPQLLTSAAMNLVSNALKFTPAGGQVILRAYQRDAKIVIEIDDECGGIPEGTGDPFRSFGDQRGADRTGLGLGLFIARKAVRAHNGEIYIRNLPGHGCIFSIEVPVALAAVPV